MLSTETKIQIVVLMAKFQSKTQVMRELKKLNVPDMPSSLETIVNVYNKFLIHGTVHDLPKSGRSSSDISKAILDVVNDHQIHSCREISNIVGISKSVVHRSLRTELLLKPYKLQFHQTLNEEDFANRVCACNEILELHQSNSSFLKNLIMSDEATFYVDGTVNRHNCRIWGNEKPDMILNKNQNAPKITIWGGMSKDGLIGPYFFRENITGENYKNMLESFLVPYLKSHRKLRSSYFQQDGAAPHFALIVRDFLNRHFSQKWIGRGGALHWPARSPDLTPLDFFLWGYLKNNVYRHRPDNLQQLEEIIQQEFSKVSNHMCQNAMDAFINRLVKCIDIDGKQVE